MKNAAAPRKPYTDEELAKLTVDQYLKANFSEDEKIRYKLFLQEKRKSQQIGIELGRLEREPLMRELTDAGVKVKSLHELKKGTDDFRIAFPILVKHFKMPYFDELKAAIAAVLANNADESMQALWPTVVEEYHKAAEGFGICNKGGTNKTLLQAKTTMAWLLSLIATDANFEQLIELIEDPSLGESRILLLDALKKSKRDLAKQTIIKLRDDPVFAREIASWKSRKYQNLTSAKEPTS